MGTDLVRTVPQGVSANASPADPVDTSHISCRVHVVNNTDTDATQKRTQSSVKVLQAADVMDIAVVVQLQHPDVAALQVGDRVQA